MGDTVSISASEARSSLFPLLKRVNEDHDVVHTNSRQHGDAVLMSADDRRSWRETVYLLRSPANAARPLKANLSGYWSRRITDEHRLVYRADDRELRIVSARYHYEQSKRSDLRITRAAPTRTPPRAWAAPRPAPASGAGAPG
ncbi:Txe/YoeB family addiction module toxin [Nocardiopsis sp. EMB25]|uniref:Txe/YoeB family addiction module toxin n=1 Tax=Nocardiopsis sp. EMB25 TaxID=2835867 RepID=UPI003FA34860